MALSDYLYLPSYLTKKHKDKMIEIHAEKLFRIDKDYEILAKNIAK